MKVGKIILQIIMIALVAISLIGLISENEAILYGAAGLIFLTAIIFFTIKKIKKQ